MRILHKANNKAQFTPPTRQDKTVLSSLVGKSNVYMDSAYQ